MTTDDERLRRLLPRPLSTPLLDPWLAPEWRPLAQVAYGTPLIPVQHLPQVRVERAAAGLDPAVTLAGRSAACVWGAPPPSHAEVYPTALPLPEGVRVLERGQAHMRFCTFVGGYRLTNPHRTALDLLLDHGLSALRWIVDMRVHLVPSQLISTLSASQLDRAVAREAAAVMAALTAAS